MWKVSLFLLFCLLSISASLETGAPHSSVQTLTQTNFRSAIHDPANGLWLLKFYAPWCAHCKKLAPVLEDVAFTVSGKMAIGKIDCDREKQLCNEFQIKVRHH